MVSESQIKGESEIEFDYVSRVLWMKEPPGGVNVRFDQDGPADLMKKRIKYKERDHSGGKRKCKFGLKTKSPVVWENPFCIHHYGINPSSHESGGGLAPVIPVIKFNRPHIDEL